MNTNFPTGIFVSKSFSIMPKCDYLFTLCLGFVSNYEHQIWEGQH